MKKHIINPIINLRSRVSRGDAIVIYTMAVIDIAFTAAVIGLIVYFI